MSDATGTDVQIAGDIGFTLLPGQQILLEKVTMKNRDSILASFDKALINLDTLPLLIGRTGIDDIELIKPSLHIERYENGKLNIESVLNEIIKRNTTENTPIKIDTITIVDGSIFYLNSQKGNDIKLNGLDLSINNLDTDSAFPENTSFTGSLEIKKLDAGLLSVSDISMHINAEKGIYKTSQFKMSLLGGAGDGIIEINTDGDSPLIKAKADITELQLSNLPETLNKENLLKGNFDLSLDITFHAAGIETIKSLNGIFMFNGKSILLNGYDIDTMLQSYKKTHEIGMLDIGAFFVAGPLGMVFKKGVEFGDMYIATNDKHGEIHEFMSSWIIKDGIASTRDVAFATGKNRLALNGKLNFVNNTYEDLNASVLDTEGCPELTQKITGPLSDPEFITSAIAKSVFGAAISLYNKAKDHISGNKCTAYYTGSIHHPQLPVKQANYVR